MEDLHSFVNEIVISTNDFATLLIEDISVEILKTLFVIVLVLHFVNLVFSFVKNI